MDQRSISPTPFRCAVGLRGPDAGRMSPTGLVPTLGFRPIGQARFSRRFAGREPGCGRNSRTCISANLCELKTVAAGE